MNIAVILDQEISAGGGFQQALSTILILNKHNSIKHNFIYFTIYKNNRKIFKNKYAIDMQHINLSLFDRIIMFLNRSIVISRIFRRLKIFDSNKLEKIFNKNSIDLVYFLSPSGLSVNLSTYNFIITVWDLYHRDAPEFPEVRLNKEFEIRENLYNKSLPKAFAVITSSYSDKLNMINYYGLNNNRIEVLPFIYSDSVNINENDYQSNFIDIKKKYNIHNDYIYYPAQFWPHKNHSYVLESLYVLKKEFNIKIAAVFSGIDKGNFDFIVQKAKKINIYDQIFYIGFVETHEISYLYKQALALVMPSWLDLTNLPVLEAFKLRCPVCFSCPEGLEEDVKEAVFLCDLSNARDLANQLMKIISKEKIVYEKIERGKKYLTKYDETYYWNGLEKIFNNYYLRLRCWK